MALSSNRSPSPISSRPRTPETASSIRRSYSGNPFNKPSVLTNPKSFNSATPANSPSDFQGLNSRVYEEKENCVKQSKIRSTPTGKSSKNFMSPTISAASKIINPSPRKKVLAERNEQVRTSMSDVRSSSSSVNIADLADDFDPKPDMGLSQNKGGDDFDAKSEMGLNQNKVGGSFDETITDFDESEALLPPVASKPPKRVTFNGSEVIPDSSVDLEYNEVTTPVVSKPPKKVTFLGFDSIIHSQNVTDPRRVTFIGSEVIPDSSVYLEHNEVTTPVVSKPPKRVTFLGSDSIIHSQNVSESSPVTELMDNVESDLKEAVSESLLISKPLQQVTFQEPSMNVEPQEPSTKLLSGSSMSPIIAPLDADPSLPPYDPKTNYLSPRPQFLRYRPNPRIEVYLHKDKGLEIGEGKRLEESFLSDSFSDTEETGSEESSPNVSEEGSPSAVPTTEELEEDSHVAALNTSNSVEVKRELKPKFFTWRKIIGLLVVVLLIASSSLYLTKSPVFEASSYRDFGMSTFYNPSEINEFAGASFDVIVKGFKEVTTSCLSYLSKLTQIAETGDLEPVQFVNLTALLENPFDDGYFKENHIAERPVEQFYAQEDVEEMEAEREPIEEESLEETEQFIESEEIALGENLQESEPYAEAEGEAVEVNVQVQIQQQSDEFAANTDFQEQPVTVEAPEEVTEAKPEVLSSGETEHVEVLTSGAKAVSNDAEKNPERSSEVDVHDSEVDSSLPNSFGQNELSENYKKAVLLPLVVLALVIIATAIYFKRSQSGAIVADPALTKKMNPENEERPREEVDIMGESCPSEMSSFEKSSSYYSKRGFRATGSEAQSQERKQRKVSKRESLASSSSDFSMSPSYGSFTTYEKIPSKHGYGEEEIVTPVRRSSRINKVTSP